MDIQAREKRMKEGREWAAKQEEQRRKPLTEAGKRLGNIQTQGVKTLGQWQQPRIWDRPEERRGKPKKEMEEE